MDSSASALWEHDRVFRDPEFRGLWASYEVLGDDTIRWTSTFRMRHPELGLRFFEWVLDTENRLRDVLFHLPVSECLCVFCQQCLVRQSCCDA